MAPVTNKQCQLELQLLEISQRLVLCEQNQQCAEILERQNQQSGAIQEIRGALVDLAAAQVSGDTRGSEISTGELAGVQKKCVELESHLQALSKYVADFATKFQGLQARLRDTLVHTWSTGTQN